MGRVISWVLLLALVILLAGAVYLMVSEPEIETKRIEKVVPNEKLGL